MCLTTTALWLIRDLYKELPPKYWVSATPILNWIRIIGVRAESWPLSCWDELKHWLPTGSSRSASIPAVTAILLVDCASLLHTPMALHHNEGFLPQSSYFYISCTFYTFTSGISNVFLMWFEWPVIITTIRRLRFGSQCSTSSLLSTVWTMNRVPSFFLSSYSPILKQYSILTVLEEHVDRVERCPADGEQ